MRPVLGVVSGGKRETIADNRRRLLAARAKSAELRLARDAGQLVLAQTVELRWSGLVVGARTKLLAIPSRLKGRCPHLTASDLVVLDALIRETLTELAETPVGTGAAP